MTAAPTAHRGRPRSEEADRAIVRAALEVLVENGAAEFSVEAVATRAGVGKSTIYRRFAGSEELLAEALATLNDDVVEPPADLPTRDALVLIMEGIRRRQGDGMPDRCLPQVLSQAQRSPVLFSIYFDRVVAPRRALVRRVLERGIERGEVRAGIDLDVLVSLVQSPMISMTVMTPAEQRTVGPETSALIVDALLEGIAPR